MEGQGDLYLMVRDYSGSVAGPLYKIGWNEQYIIYTDANRPEPWNVIDVRNYTRVSISDALRTSSRRFQAIRIMEPAEAWRGGGLKRR